MSEVPPGGVPRSVFESTALGRELLGHIEYWSNQYGMNPQYIMDVFWQESGAGEIGSTAHIQQQAPTHGANVFGPAALRRGTYEGVGVTDPQNPGQATMGLVRVLDTYGRGGNIGPNGPQGMSLQWDPLRALVFYNGGPTIGREWELTGRDNSILRGQTQNYIRSISQGTGFEYNQQNINRAWANTPDVARNWQLEDQAFSGTGPNQQHLRGNAWGQNPVGDFWAIHEGPSGSIGRPPFWETPGLINPEYGHYLQQQGLMPANLQPSGGTDFTNTTWNAIPGSQPGWWGPWGAEAVHNWAQEGITHGYGDPIMSMLGNLNYNLVDPGLPPGSPPLGGQPAPIGPTTGLPGTATAGVDLPHWLAQQWGSSWGNRGLDPGLEIWDATPGVHVQGRPFSDSPNVWDASGVQPGWGGHSDLTFWNATAPAGAPPPPPAGTPPVLNWQPAPGGWGEPGPGGVGAGAGWAELQQSGNPNNWSWNPATLNWGTFGGGGGIDTAVTDYNAWYDRIIGGAAQPEGGFNPVGHASGGYGTGLPSTYVPAPYVSPGGEEGTYIAGSVNSPIPTPPGGYGSPYPAPMPAPTIWYFNSGIGPGGIPIAPGLNTTPILTYQIGPGGVPLAPGSTTGILGLGGSSMAGMADRGASATGSMGGSHDTDQRAVGDQQQALANGLDPNVMASGMFGGPPQQPQRIGPRGQTSGYGPPPGWGGGTGIPGGAVMNGGGGFGQPPPQPPMPQPVNMFNPGQPMLPPGPPADAPPGWQMPQLMMPGQIPPWMMWPTNVGA